jgi:deoxyxylulose-5-phosphate synthase
MADKFLVSLTMPDAIVDHGPQKTFRKLYFLDAEGIAFRVREVLGALRDEERQFPPMAIR